MLYYSCSLMLSLKLYPCFLMLSHALSCSLSCSLMLHLLGAMVRHLVGLWCVVCVKYKCNIQHIQDTRHTTYNTYNKCGKRQM
jgi:hypothetical protein